MADKRKKFDYHNSPTAWFSMLEGAINKGDFECAAQAVRELKRLGVTVKYKGNTAKKLAKAEKFLANQKLTILGGNDDRK